MFKIFGIGFFLRIKGVFNVNIGTADIFFHIAVDSRYIYGNLSHTVKLVPGEKKFCLFTFFYKGAYNKITCCDIAEVTDMN